MKLAIVFSAALAAVGVAVPAVAQNAPVSPPPARFDRMLVFGDSLVDAGNAQEGRLRLGLPDPAPPALGYDRGRFSNGLTFADYVSQSLGLGETQAFLRGGNNFAVGGAKAAGTGAESLSFGEQVATFAATGQRLDANALVLVTFGGNDLRDELEQFVDTGGADAVDLEPAVAALTAGLRTLGTLGARNFVVTGLPDIGQLPEITGNGALPPNAFATGFSELLNARFGAAAGSFGGETGYNVGFYDLFNQQKAIYADPARFGLPTSLNTRTACLTVPGAAPACDGYVYFDAIHPTTALHSAIAQGIRELPLVGNAVPEPATWGVMVLGFGLAGAAMRRRRPARVTMALAA